MTQRRHAVTTNLAGRGLRQPITAETFQRVGKARDRLLACLALEEAFAVLLANYRSFEKAVSAANIENMIDRAASRVELDDRRREVDRHLINVLAAGEMFTDHVKRQLRRAFGRAASEGEVVAAAYEHQRERLLGFWATECLRDAVLHRSLPISSWTMGSTWVGLEREDGVLDKLNPDARMEYSVLFTFDPEVLTEDRNVDQERVARFKAGADQRGRISWVRTIREYIEALSFVLQEVRTVFEPSERAAVTLLGDLAEAYRSAFTTQGVEPPHYAFAVEFDDDDHWSRELVLNFDFEELVAHLRQRHRPMMNLHRRGLKD